MPLHPKGRVLVLAPDRNSPPRKDFDGAFKPAAEALRKSLNATVVYVPVPTVDSETLVISSREKQRGFERAAGVCLEAIRGSLAAHVVFLCHGWSKGLQLGFRSAGQRGNDRAIFDDLCVALSARAISVCLFACSAGDEPLSKKSSPGTGDNSFADTLRDRTGAPVLAHWSVGHATRNPDLIFFQSSDAPLVGGTSVERGKALYKNAVKLLSAGSKAKPNPAGRKPPVGDVRPAWQSLPLVTTWTELHALLSQKPAT